MLLLLLTNLLLMLLLLLRLSSGRSRSVEKDGRGPCWDYVRGPAMVRHGDGDGQVGMTSTLLELL